MRFISLALIVGSLSACDLNSAPSSEVADEIEAKVTKISCIGRMSGWERHYSFSTHPDMDLHPIDQSRVVFRYYQVGFRKFRPGRVFFRETEPPRPVEEENYKLVEGEYDIPTHTATVFGCGPRFNGL